MRKPSLSPLRIKWEPTLSNDHFSTHVRSAKLRAHRTYFRTNVCRAAVHIAKTQGSWCAVTRVVAESSSLVSVTLIPSRVLPPASQTSVVKLRFGGRAAGESHDNIQSWCDAFHNTASTRWTQLGCWNRGRGIGCAASTVFLPSS